MFCIDRIAGKIKQMCRDGAIFGEPGKNFGDWGLLICAPIYNSGNFLVLMILGQRHYVQKMFLYRSSKSYDPMSEKEMMNLKILQAVDLGKMDMHPINKRARWMIDSLAAFGPISASLLSEKIALDLKSICREMRQYDEAIISEVKRIMAEKNGHSMSRKAKLKKYARNNF